MFLTGEKKKTPTPTWMKVGLSVMSTLISFPNFRRFAGENSQKSWSPRRDFRIFCSTTRKEVGLYQLILIILPDSAGDHWTDNLPMTKQVAWHVATVPKLFRHPMEYHERMSRQFFETMYKQVLIMITIKERSL